MAELTEITKNQLPVMLEYDTDGEISAHHGIITGINGSGKSYLAKALIERQIESRQYSMVVIIDPKRQFKLSPNANVKIVIVDSIAAMNDNPAHVYIYRVKPNTSKESELEQYNIIFEWLFNRDKTGLIYIDEMYMVCPTRMKYPNGLMTIYTMGRSKGVSIISTMQRPANVPPFTSTECRNYFCFELMRIEDRRRMTDFMGRGVMVSPVETSKTDYSFWYYDTNERKLNLRKLKR